MLPGCSAPVELETSQENYVHAGDTRETFGVRGRLPALAEAQAPEEAAHGAHRGHPGVCRGLRRAACPRGVTATSAGRVAQEAQYKDKGKLSDLLQWNYNNTTGGKVHQVIKFIG